jgi:ferredoxin
VGFSDCIGQAPEAFALDEAGVVTFLNPERVERERIISACDLCPVDALTVWDETGAQIVPS